jgi:acetyl esterase/lipase
MILKVHTKNIIFYAFSYQLTPSVHYPTPTDEGVKVARYVMTNYQEFAIDPTHVFLCGDSAGMRSFIILI